MKHALYTLTTALVFCTLALALSGCQAIGFGKTGNGIPAVGQAKISSPAIAEEGILRVGVDGSNAPFSTMVDNKMVGIDADVAAALADELGLKLKLVDVGTTPEAALENNTVDIVMGMDISNTSSTCWLSNPYLATAVAIFATSSGAILPTAENDAVIEAQESSMSAWEVTNQFGEDALKPVSDLKTVFEDLESGAITYGAADAIIGSYVTRASSGKAMIIGLMQRAGGYCIGVSGSNTELRDAITEAVSSLSNNGVVDVIESKWIGSSINFDSIALTEAASKAIASTPEKKPDTDSSDENKKTDLGTVGTNAVDLQDDGSTGEGNDAPVVVDGYWGGAYTYVAPVETPQAETTYVDPGATEYTDPNAGGMGAVVTDDGIGAGAVVDDYAAPVDDGGVYTDAAVDTGAVDVAPEAAA